ncbi:unnamed protein product [Rotaria sp. Silwood1]|nr:unnamed protein product [Rotaria sp. Silwood1]CAF1458507.1 unnamed protein product [Rotaria sp. Silwood1]CAF3642218.1 unnamed protein product [Rotaria sp. Silwood1]
MAFQIASGINYLHQLPEPILHRDIKSLNFLIQRAYEGYIVKVCDFGLARTRNETTRYTTFNSTLAHTLPWTAPEILLLEDYVDKSDIYSLGIVFWELASRRVPYYEHKDDVIRTSVLAGDRLQIPESTPSGFQTIIERCWAQQPNDRPNSSYLVEMIEECIQMQIIRNIPVDAPWPQNGKIVAGGNGQGNATNQLNYPHGLFVDDDQTMIIADCWNDRIVQWKMGDTMGQVVAGGKDRGNRSDQLYGPIDVLVDKETGSLIICDWQNRRVVRWSPRNGTTQGEILIDNIDCHGLFMDDQRYLYVSDYIKHEVRRYKIGDKNGIIVAGGNGKGAALNQLNSPTYAFVDQQQNVYVSDTHNHRVTKWNKGAKEGIVVAGGQGEGNALTQLSHSNGLFIDTLGNVYVADSWNNRVMRWPKGAKQGTVIVGGNGEGAGANQFNRLRGLSFDRKGNLYVVDVRNHRVHLFSIQ